MLFDADAIAEGLEPPQVKLGGKLYTGRILSAWEMAKYQVFIDELGKGEQIDPDVIEKWTHQLVEEMFGRKVLRKFRRLSPILQLKGVLSFMKAQVEATKTMHLGLEENAGQTK